MNNVSMVGRLTRDPELKDVRGGKVCQLRIAIDNPGRSGAKGEPTYVDVLRNHGRRISAGRVGNAASANRSVSRNRCDHCLSLALEPLFSEASGASGRDSACSFPARLPGEPEAL